MNTYEFYDAGKDERRKVRARTEAGARSRLPKGPRNNWVLLDVIKPPVHPDSIPLLKQKTVELCWGIGGPVIGKATVRTDGTVEAHIDQTIRFEDGTVPKDLRNVFGVSFEGSIAPYFNVIGDE